MTPWGDILDHVADFDPALDIETFARGLPGRWVVYLLADGRDRPVQLLCVKNLRASMKRRLGEGDMGDPAERIKAGPSRKVDYRAVVRRIHWRRVDSDLEADWVHLEAARAVFPETYRSMTGYRPAWFVHVDPDAAFPRYIKTTEIDRASGIHLGPLEDKQSAARLIELIEDSFDLCRYHNILIQAPRGRACAYKEMGKCPAPCDGSIAMDQYRRMIAWSAATLASPMDYVAEQQQRMRAAAAELRFETAAKIKAFIDQIGQFGKGPYRHIRRLEDFRYLSIQRGPRAGTAKVFIITPGGIHNPLNLIGPPRRIDDLLTTIRASVRRMDDPIDSIRAERLAVAAHHLFDSRTQGTYIPLDSLDEITIAKAYQAVRKQKVDLSEDEGVVKESAAI